MLAAPVFSSVKPIRSFPLAWSTVDHASSNTRYCELGRVPGMGVSMAAAVKLGLHVFPPSVDLAAITTLFFRLDSFGPLTQVTYTVPSGPTDGRASWSNWWPASLTRMGPVQ